MLSGENGILQKSTEAKRITERAEAKEQAQLDILAWVSDKTSKNENSTLNDSIVQGILDEKSYVKEAKATSFITAKGEYEIPYSELYTSNETLSVVSVDEIVDSGEFIGLFSDTESVFKYENNYYKIDMNDNITRLNVEKYFLIQGAEANQVIFYSNNIETWTDFIASPYNSSYGFSNDIEMVEMVTKGDGWFLRRESSWVKVNDSIINEGLYRWDAE